MTDAQSTTQSGEQPLLNDPASRTPTGEIKDQSPQNTTQQESTTTETKGSIESLAGKPDAKADAKSDAKSDSAGAPEKYEPFKLPEGFEANEKQLSAFEAKARELNLSQEAAQGLVDFYSGLIKETAEAPFKAYQETRASWVKEVVSDPTLGNGKDGLNPEVKAAIGRVKDLLDPKERAAFEEAMDFTGAGDNPAFVRAFYKFAKSIVEGTSVKAGNPSTPDKKAPTTAQAIWPSLPSSAS